MSLLHDLPLNRLTPSRLWGAIDAETRRLAARCLYDPDRDDVGGRAEADAAIASALRFRAAAVRRLPVAKRVAYLIRAAQPDDSLATALLRALHLSQRSEMLGVFLDELGIPQQGGVIDTDEELDAPGGEELVAAVGALRGSYPAEEVDLYLAALLFMEPDFWSGLTAVVGTGSRQ
jgi:hypothetical protein